MQGGPKIVKFILMLNDRQMDENRLLLNVNAPFFQQYLFNA